MTKYVVTSGWMAVAILTAIGLSGVSGVVQGISSGRWGQRESVREAAERLNNIPSSFGAWELKDLQPLSKEVEAILESPVYLAGTYINRQTGELVGAVVLAGPPGPIAVHSPDICYSSAHYEIRDQRDVSIGGPHSADKLWQLDLLARSVDATPLRVYYGWSAGEQWEAPSNPRVSFAGSSLLYKVQIAFDPTSDHNDGRDLGQRFLADYLQAIKPFTTVAK